MGLLLEQPHFHSYNRKVLESNARIEARLKKAGSGKGGSKAGSTDTPSKEADEANQLRDPIDYAAVEDKVEQFKRDVILKTMYDEEDKEDTFALWLNLHDGQTGPEFDYLNVKGVIRKCFLRSVFNVSANSCCPLFQHNLPSSERVSWHKITKPMLPVARRGQRKLCLMSGRRLHSRSRKMRKRFWPSSIAVDRQLN